MRLPLSARCSASQPTKDEKKGESDERTLLHGTLFVYIRRARDLGRSHTIAIAEKDRNRRTIVKNKLSAGARFFGKKMLNAVRTTNHVRFASRALSEYMGSYERMDTRDHAVITFNA